MWEIPKPPVMLVADLDLAGDRLLSVVGESLRAGCKWVLVRVKSSPPNILAQVTSRIMQLSKIWDALVFVSRHPEVAAENNAHGVHLPWGSNPGECRRVLGYDVVVGMSTHSLDEALHAEKLDADYITLSPIYPSISKPSYNKSLGLQQLKEVADRVRIPVIALGGITLGRAGPCLASGARGVAVSGAVIYAQNPYEVMADLISEVLTKRPPTFQKTA
ncbi:MAG: thiamine phosphate synthase [Nitrososphaerota archaeon]